MTEKNETRMNASIKELVAIGASVGAHCQPCLRHHIQAALELGVTEEEIRQAVEVGHSLEKGALVAMKKFTAASLDELFPDQPEEVVPGEGEKQVLKIYDPALCCSSGVCGPSVDPVLAQFAGTIKFVAAQPGIEVERYNLGQQPQAFVENAQVKELLADGGEKRLPFLFIDDRLWLQERYPSREELLQALEITSDPMAFPVASSSESAGDGACCGEGGCC